MRRIALALAAAVFGWLSLAGAASAAPALWLVRNEHARIYLFGTLHALPPQVQWRTPLFDAVYAEAQTVWFEAAVDAADPVMINNIVARYGVDPDRPLSRKLAPADLARLRQATDVARIDHLRPWAAAIMLSMQPVLGSGATVDAGADSVITRAARGEAKRVRAFETLEDQARMFAGLSEPAEVGYLAEVLRERHARPHLLPLRPSPESLQTAWLAGDVQTLGVRLAGGLKAENPGLYEALLKRRNLAWADALSRELAEGSGVELVNVGALHLVGDDGLPTLLAARGFSVTRLQ